MTFPQCDICGVVSLDVRPGIAEYRATSSGRVTYKALMRCSDHAACEERVRESGEEWPIVKEGAPA